MVQLNVLPIIFLEFMPTPEEKEPLVTAKKNCGTKRGFFHNDRAW